MSHHDAVPAPQLVKRAVIVHVAESFASGTSAAIADFVRNYPQGEHHLVYSLKDAARIDPRELKHFDSAEEMPSGTLARVRFLRRYLRNAAPTVVVHAHSSKAGVYARLAVRRTQRRPLLYTPHCYAFERLDVARPLRALFRFAEWLLSFNTTAYGACSPREAELSRWSLRTPRAVSVPNVCPPGLPQRSPARPGGPLRIVGNGRLGPQKDPQFFAEAVAAASEIHPDIHAVWVGGGDDSHAELLRASGVEVTGWLPRHRALEVMADADLYLHTATWEGFPISVMEASGMGLPVVVRRGPYLAGVDLPIVIDHPEEFAKTILDLLAPGAMESLRQNTVDALAGHTDADQQAALHELYEPLLAGR